MASWLLVTFLGTVACGIALLGWAFFRHPLAFNAAWERLRLRASGFHPVTVRTGVGSLRAWVVGEGACLVFLHGAGDQSGTWAFVAPSLTSSFKVVLLDLPGHGASAPKKGALPLPTLVQGTREAVLRLCGSGAVLIGNSLGAWLGSLLAVDQAVKPKALVLVNGGPMRGHYLGVPKTREAARQMMRVLMGPEGDTIPSFILDDVVRTGEKGPIARLLAALESWEPHLWDEETLRNLALPVLLLWGAEDRLFDRAYAEKLAHTIPKCELRWIPGCGHLPQRQCPRSLLQGLYPWLHQVAGTNAAR